MTTIVFKSNQANYQLPVFPHITYNKVTVELNGGSGGGGPQKGGAGAKLKATVPDITGKNLKITLRLLSQNWQISLFKELGQQQEKFEKKI